MMRKYITFIIILAWLGIIFLLSSQLASTSNALSKEVTKVVVSAVEVVNPNTDLTLETLNNKVRKNAHFFIYFVLAILLLSSLRHRGKLNLRNIFIAFSFCILFAVTDEFHQLFVDGRGGQLRDILIDSSGALTGIFLYILLNWFRILKKETKKP